LLRIESEYILGKTASAFVKVLCRRNDC